MILFGLPFGCPLAQFWGVIGWGASRERRAACASWGLSRTYLPSLKRKVEPFPCPRLVPAPGVAVQVTWYEHRGTKVLRVRQNRGCDPNAPWRSVPSNRLVPLGDFRLNSVVFSAEIHHAASFAFSVRRGSEYFRLLRNLTMPRVKRGPGVTHEDHPCKKRERAATRWSIISNERVRPHDEDDPVLRDALGLSARRDDATDTARARAGSGVPFSQRPYRLESRGSDGGASAGAGQGEAAICPSARLDARDNRTDGTSSLLIS